VGEEEEEGNQGRIKDKHFYTRQTDGASSMSNLNKLMQGNQRVVALGTV